MDKEVTSLREQIDLLMWEKQLIKERVRKCLEALIVENETLKARIAELESEPGVKVNRKNSMDSKCSSTNAVVF